MSADKQPESVFDNDREARALALKLAVDAAAGLPGRVRDALGDQSADELSARILIDAQAFAGFIQTGDLPRSVERLRASVECLRAQRFAGFKPAPEERTDV